MDRPAEKATTKPTHPNYKWNKKSSFHSFPLCTRDKNCNFIDSRIFWIHFLNYSFWNSFWEENHSSRMPKPTLKHSLKFLCSKQEPRAPQTKRVDVKHRFCVLHLAFGKGFPNSKHKESLKSLLGWERIPVGVQCSGNMSVANHLLWI